MEHALNPFDLDGDVERLRRRKSEATAKGGQAFLRLLHLAESGDSGQAHTVARFIASSYNGQDFPYDLYDLRLVDVAISDDMLLCIDALRWAQSDLHTLVPDGDRRVRAVIDLWGIQWPQAQ
jgi:hypothetical protein